jgi:nucleotide-binding universal stress UspA family protein
MGIQTYNKILYATDLGKNMRPVFRHAISLAKQYDASIVMLHVVEPLSSAAKWALEAYLPEKTDLDLRVGNGLRKVLAEMKQRLERFYDEEMSDDPDKDKLVSDIVVVSGNTAEQIQGQAEEHGVDLIVVGSHTSSGMERGFIGSDVRRLIHITDRPTLVVPVVRK